MNTKARFLTGSPLRHVTIMTFTASVGLMAMFVVDLVDMYFLSLLGEVELAAAIGYAGAILFFNTAVSIGLSIACGALVSKAVGQGRMNRARRYASNTLIFVAVLSSLVAILTWIYADPLLQAVGATGRALDLATIYLRIVIVSSPMLALSMAGGAVLRAVGDARRSMNMTLIAGIVNAVLDPIFIFGLDMGISGAALASAVARISTLAFVFNGVFKVHQMVLPTRLGWILEDLRRISAIAFPAMATNVATPIAGAFVTASIAAYGVDFVAGHSVIGRLVPVAFAVVFALSGAVGPIIGQNFGAREYGRVRRTLIDSALFVSAFVAIVALVMFLLRFHIIEAFSLQQDAASLVLFFCTWLAILFIFDGLLFVSNASFNNLGHPLYSTLFNFGKVFVGVIPLATLLGHYYGVKGVLVGQALGSVLAGTVAFYVSMLVTTRIEQGRPLPNPLSRLPKPRVALWPQSSAKSNL